MLSIQQNGLRVSIDETGDILLERGASLAFRQRGMGERYALRTLREERGQLCFTLLCPGGLTLEGALGFTDAGDPMLELRGDRDAVMPEQISYPPALLPRPDDSWLIAMSLGFAFPAADEAVFVPPVRKLSCGSDGAMGVWGLLRGDSWILNVVDTKLDADECHAREDGLLRTRVAWKASKGRWGYDRRTVWLLGETGGVTAAAKAYRRYLAAKGLVVTFEEKARSTPRLRDLAGAADIWVWDDHALDSAKPKVQDRPYTPFDALRVAREMKALGMDRLLWGGAGVTDRATADQFRALGCLLSKYDMYRDVMPASFREAIGEEHYLRNRHRVAWPNDVIHREDGSDCPCWEVLGLDGKMHAHSAMCDIMALKYATAEIPEDKRRLGLDCRFVDTVSSCDLDECWDPDHPMDHRKCLQYRLALMKFIRDIGLLSGIEDALEEFVPVADFSEGIMSNFHYRMYDAGRRMTTMYFGDEVEAHCRDFLMDGKYRVPFWELVFHDCFVSYWYWGDTNCCCPEYMERRDLLNALYANPPIYSFDMSQWDQYKQDIADSYLRIRPATERAAMKEMLSFRWLTEDRLVQETVFDGGTVITANFSPEAYTLPDGTVLPPCGKSIRSL